MLHCEILSFGYDLDMRVVPYRRQIKNHCRALPMHFTCLMCFVCFLFNALICAWSCGQYCFHLFLKTIFNSLLLTFITSLKLKYSFYRSTSIYEFAHTYTYILHNLIINHTNLSCLRDVVRTRRQSDCQFAKFPDEMITFSVSIGMTIT